MSVRFSTGAVSAAASIALALSLTPSAMAVDFRVLTRIYVEGEDDPVSETTTVFKRGLVYDMPSAGGAVWTVMNPAEQKFVLLKAETKQKAVISFGEIQDLVTKFQQLGIDAGKTDVFAPEFKESVEQETNRLVFENAAMKYRVKALQPNQKDVVDQYRSFGDWFARLNLRYASNYPPFGRLKLNEALQKRSLVPSELELTLLPQGGNLKVTVLRSTHDYQWILSANDEKNVELAQRQLSLFSDVTFSELFPDEIAAKDKANAKR